MRTEVKVFTTPAGVAGALAAYLHDLAASLSDLHIALSGGSTPKIFFEELVRYYQKSIDWNKIHLYWGDERCVPPSHADSNYGMTERLLISNVPVATHHIHRVLGENEPKTEAARYSTILGEKLPTYKGWPAFDLVILGMGTDGHTASIFPDQMDLIHSTRICEVAKHPESGQPRITLTGPTINHARRVTFLVTGKEKAPKLKEIISQSGSWTDYPAAHIQPTGELLWYLDKSAAGET